MQGPSSGRVVVTISALLTLLVLGAGTLALGLRNGWLQLADAAPSQEALAAPARLADTEPSPALPTPRPGNPAPALEAAADPAEIAVYRNQLEEAYRALDEAYAQIRTLQTAQTQLASSGDGERSSAEHDDDDDDRERGSRRGESRHD